MITFKRGNLFESSAQCCVIPVNMEGAMGAGLAEIWLLKYSCESAATLARRSTDSTRD